VMEKFVEVNEKTEWAASKLATMERARLAVRESISNEPGDGPRPRGIILIFTYADGQIIEDEILKPYDSSPGSRKRALEVAAENLKMVSANNLDVQ